MAPGALGEKGTADERLDGADVDPKESRGAALHHFQAGTVGVMEGKDDAGGVFAWREISRVSKPTRWEKDFTAVTDGVMRELACEVLRGGD